MAIFAELNKNNLVLRVIAVNNSELLDENGVESEAKGIAFCKSVCGQDTVWKQGSYNTRGGVHYTGAGEVSADQTKAFRKNKPAAGRTYDESRDAFIPPQILSNLVFNETTCLFEIPPQPTDPIPAHCLYSWRSTNNGEWYIMDTETDTEYEE